MARVNDKMTEAKKAKNDEFYTQLVDIEKELKHYKEHFIGKTVFCNCDDPYESNFFKYFALNFNFLGLKKLIATSYDTSPVAYTQLSFVGDEKIIPNNNRKAYKIEITEVDDYNGDGAFDLSDVEYLLMNKKNTLSLLSGDGDFRSEECIELLKEADIVVTNPPFSLFREYVAQLIEYDKKFIIIGNQNAITYKEIFPLIKNNQLFLGLTMNGSNRYFQVPDDYPLTEKTGKIVDGKKYAFVKSVVWFTNFNIYAFRDNVIPYREYCEADYPKYDNYDAIEVSKVTDIPKDYYGVMGVPITYLHKYSPEQFELIGLLNSSNEELAGIKCLRKYTDFKEIRQDLTFTGSSGNKTNGNPVLKGKPKSGNYYVNIATDEVVYSTYARILIRRKKNED